MKLKIQGRQTGKTYDIAQEMKKDEDTICIQPNQMQKNKFCKDCGIKKDRVFTLNEILEKTPPQSKVYIDEIDGCLMQLLKKRIVWATFTGLFDVKTRK